MRVSGLFPRSKQKTKNKNKSLSRSFLFLITKQKTSLWDIDESMKLVFVRNIQRIKQDNYSTSIFFFLQ